MTNHDIKEAIISQINRYQTALLIFNCAPPLNPLEDPRLWTEMEDCAEFGMELVKEVCIKEEDASAR